jgi:hypothetical protein
VRITANLLLIVVIQISRKLSQTIPRAPAPAVLPGLILLSFLIVPTLLAAPLTVLCLFTVSLPALLAIPGLLIPLP